MNRSVPGRRQSGFSLLEVLIAFAILALSLGVLLQIFSRAMSTVHVGGGYSRATTVAEAKLNAVGADIPLEEGVHSGDPDGGIEWQVNIVPYELDGHLADQQTVAPYRVTATALWGEGERVRRLTLTTLRLGEPF